jgi:putative ABC transport system ATP-binding protein
VYAPTSPGSRASSDACCDSPEFGRDFSLIRFANIRKHFGEAETRVEALRCVNLEVPRGQMCAIMGPSGSGKSTLLHLAAGLVAPDQGDVTLDGSPITTLNEEELSLLRRRKIGIVFQFFNLLPYLTAEENVALPLRLDERPEAEVRDSVARTLEMVGMTARARHKANTLSGGEMQRVAIARALAISPAVVLADEPTGNLDSVAGRQIIELLRELNDETGVTMLVVTHDPVWGSFCDRIVRLSDGVVAEDIALDGDG